MGRQDFTIRTVEGRDSAAIVEVWNQALHRDPTTVGRFARWLFLSPDYDPATGEGAWIAERQGECVGFIRAIKRLFPNDAVGTEDDLGWIGAVFVAPEHQRQGIGSRLLDTAVDWLRSRGTKRIYVCGNTGSAPGYLFPGVDRDAYAGGLALFERHGFVVDHQPVAMAGSLLDMDHERLHAIAWADATNEGVRIEPLRPETMREFLAFLRQSFPGDWNTAARIKLRSDPLDEVLLAFLDDQIVGYCQWEGEHFGPFGVREDVRSKRIGAKLFAEATRRIMAEGGRTVWFNWADEDAARFYERFGLHATRRFSILRKDL